MKKLLFLIILLLYAIPSYGQIYLIAKIAPKNDGFQGMVDDDQIIDTATTVGFILISDGDYFASVAPMGNLFPADPNADKCLMWDDDPGTLVWTDCGGGGGNAVYVEEGDAAKADSSGADLYIDFDATDFEIGVVGNEANITIPDDGHAHTGTSLSGIDISGDTNLAAGRSLTLSGDSVEADAELYTDVKCGLFENVTDDDNFIFFYAKTAITITDIECIVEDATSVVITMQECDSAADNCSGVDGASTITCDVDGASDDGTLSNGGIDAGDWIRLDIGTVTGTVGFVTVCITFTWND